MPRYLTVFYGGKKKKKMSIGVARTTSWLNQGDGVDQSPLLNHSLELKLYP